MSVAELRQDCCIHLTSRMLTSTSHTASNLAIYRQRRTSLNYEWFKQNCLGRGTFAKVYKGNDRHTGGLVAVKVCDLNKCMDKSNGYNGRYYIEDVARLRTFNSRYIIKYFAAEEVNDSPSKCAIIMELADGCLRNELQKNTNNHGLPMPVFLILVVNCLNALEYLDDKNLSHRDLKPENIFVFHRNGLVFKLGDFGLGYSLSERNQSMHSEVGTLAYMPRCMIEGVGNEEELRYTKDEYDLWSGTCCFFEAATNRHPFVQKPVKGVKTLLCFIAFLANSPEDMVCGHFDAETKQHVYDREMPEQHSSYTETFRSTLVEYFQLLFSPRKAYLVMKRFSKLTRGLLLIGMQEVCCIGSGTLQAHSNTTPSSSFTGAKTTGNCSDDRIRSAENAVRRDLKIDVFNELAEDNSITPNMSENNPKKNFCSAGNASRAHSTAGVGTRAAEMDLHIHPNKAGETVPAPAEGASKVSGGEGNSSTKDAEEETTKNTVKARAVLVAAGITCGAFGGAVAGATIGAIVFPVAVVFVGGVIGSFVGGAIGCTAGWYIFYPLKSCKAAIRKFRAFLLKNKFRCSKNFFSTF